MIDYKRYRTLHLTRRPDSRLEPVSSTSGNTPRFDLDPGTVII